MEKSAHHHVFQSITDLNDQFKVMKYLTESGEAKNDIVEKRTRTKIITEEIKFSKELHVIHCREYLHCRENSN